MVQFLPECRNLDTNRNISVRLMDSEASLFEILLAKIFHSSASLERINALEVDAEKCRIEVDEVAINLVSHLLVLIIKPECFALKQTFAESLDILFHAIDSNAIGQI